MGLTGRKVLVTGAGGFIGSHLTEMLVSEGADVTALVHYNSRNDWGCLEFIDKKILEKVHVIPGDITDPFVMKKISAGKEVIFHLAALIGIPYSYVAPAHYVGVNVSGTVNVMEAAKESGARVIHTSTSETYGTAQYTPIDEKHPLVGQSPYSASKISADKMAESYYRAFDIPVVIVRPFNTYGPRQSARAVIPTIMTQLASGHSTIELGSLLPIRDLTYVEDTARGFLLAASSQDAVGKTINLGYGMGISIGDLVEKIIKISGSDAKVVSMSDRIRPDASEVMELVSDNSLAREVLDWKPEISLDDGLKKTYEYIEKNIERYKPGIYNI